MSYVWHTPSVLCLIWLAFLVNLTAFPLSHSLLPYVAREIYATDATGLGHLVAAFATGALLGSTIMTVAREQSSRFMVICIALWYALIAVFARMTAAPYGMSVLFVMGVCHSLGMVTMSGVLLRIVADRFRGRVMGIRMLAVYGLPLGLLISGPLGGAVRLSRHRDALRRDRAHLHRRDCMAMARHHVEELSGTATDSSERRSARTPINASSRPARIIRTAPNR